MPKVRSLWYTARPGRLGLVVIIEKNEHRNSAYSSKEVYRSKIALLGIGCKDKITLFCM